MAADRDAQNIVVESDNQVSHPAVDVVIGELVRFYPTSSLQTLTITFASATGNPFGWQSNTKTGSKGQPIEETVQGQIRAYDYGAYVAAAGTATPLRLTVIQ